jgi:hypothetical protein
LNDLEGILAASLGLDIDWNACVYDEKYCEVGNMVVEYIELGQRCSGSPRVRLSTRTENVVAEPSIACLRAI